jgi:hypothetical protein
MLLRYRGLTIYALLFSVLFVLHIVFAAHNQNVLFQIVAVVITAMSFFCGPICVFLEGKKELYRYVFQFGMIASVPICVGLGWAYNDMSFGSKMVIFPLFSLFIHYIIRLSPIGHTYGLK